MCALPSRTSPTTEATNHPPLSAGTGRPAAAPAPPERPLEEGCGAVTPEPPPSPPVSPSPRFGNTGECPARRPTPPAHPPGIAACCISLARPRPRERMSPSLPRSPGAGLPRPSARGRSRDCLPRPSSRFSERGERPARVGPRLPPVGVDLVLSRWCWWPLAYFSRTKRVQLACHKQAWSGAVGRQ